MEDDDLIIISKTDGTKNKRQSLSEPIAKEEKLRAYWKEQLQDLPELHSLALDYARPPQQILDSKAIDQAVDEVLVSRIHQYCQNKQVTLFMFLQSAFSILLSRYSHETDIVMGSPASGNTDAAPSEYSLGNILVLRSDLTGNPKFSELLDKNRQTILDAYEHQSISFKKLVEEIKPEVNLSHNPLFQIMLTHTNERAVSELVGLKADSLISSGTRYDLELKAIEQADKLNLEWTFKTSLFASETIERMSTNFLVLLDRIIENPESFVGELLMLTRQEQRLVQLEWNDNGSVDLQDLSVVSLFEEQVEAAPDAIAVSDEEESLTYRQLSNASNRLGKYLKNVGIGPDSLVGLCIDRSVNMVVCVLGIMKAGGAYVPLDPKYPPARLSYMLEDAGAEVVLTQKNLVSSLPRSVHAICLDNEAVLDVLSGRSACNANNLAAIAPDQLAYVIYTSGSTGNPKGVCIEHRALCNFLLSMAEKPGFEKTDCLLAVISISFDMSVLEIFLPLIRGGKIYIAQAGQAFDSHALQSLIKEKNITFMQATQTTWRMLLDGGWSGKKDFVAMNGGEAWPLSLNQAIQPLVKEVWNGYGPTETTIYSTVAQIKPDVSDISVGRGIFNTQVYVLDEYGKLAPIGAVGELYIGGAGLARGYLNNPEKTSERFITNPFDSSTRLYRTGDLMRWRADGRLEFLGRTDNQVKIRGFRIECGEIEKQLQKISGICNACVVALELSMPLGKVCEGPNFGEKNLVAFIELDNKAVTLIDIRKSLNQLLPRHMIPSYFKIMENLPLTPNKKIDRSKLRLPAEA